MDNQFTWMAFYKEMAQKLLQFKNNRMPLVNWIYRSLDSSYLSHFKDDNKGKRVSDVDPFTVFALFNRGISKEKRIDICSKFKSYLNINAAVPQDFVGIPIMNPMQSNFMAFEANRESGDIKRLWDVFEAAVNNRDIKQQYDALNGQYLIKFNLTMGLYWIRPDRFMPLDGNSRTFLKKLGIRVDTSKFLPYDDYANIMKQLNAKMKAENLGFTDYPGFSDAAYMDRGNDDESNDDETTEDIHYWMYSPGEYARMWDDCVRNGIMCLGWDQLGDFGKYKDREAMRKKMPSIWGPNSSYTNDSLATWQFLNDIQIGDVIFAKKGLTHIVGRGIVEGEYKYEPSRKEYIHTRKVRWTDVGDWETNGQQAMKTLTDITSYTDYVEKLNRMIDGYQQGSQGVAEPRQAGYRNYWFLVANPAIWSVTKWKVGDIESYSLYSEKRNKRRVFQNFLDAKVGDLVVCYEGSPLQKVTAIASISKETDGYELWFKKEKALNKTISLSEIRKNRLLSKMEFMVNPNGSLFKLTPDEFVTIMNLVGENVSEQPHGIKYTKDDFLNEVFISEEDYENLYSLLLRKKNLILQGAPGVGKTFAARRLTYSIMGEKDDSRVMQVQFHQNYSYEDFVMGYKPNEDGGFELKNGLFYRFCKRAAADREHKYFFIIDEINRGNLSKIFGELLMLIEDDYRDKPIQLSYKDEQFSVPENLYLIGMMNTADRSLAMIDYALRRRFSFFEMKPGFENPAFKAYCSKLSDPQLNKLVNAIIELNKVIENDDSLGSGFFIGHSYLCNLKGSYNLSNIVEYDIIPMLREYWFDNNDRFNQEAQKLRDSLK